MQDADVYLALGLMSSSQVVLGPSPMLLVVRWINLYRLFRNRRSTTRTFLSEVPIGRFVVRTTSSNPSVETDTWVLFRLFLGSWMYVALSSPVDYLAWEELRAVSATCFSCLHTGKVNGRSTGCKSIRRGRSTNYQPRYE